MNEISIIRTPQIVAAEINGIKAQTRTMLLCSSIEIGRRLVEAKSMVEHGGWGEWLKNSIDYSPRTAQNLMKIFDEYGADQMPLFGDNSKTQAFADLTYSQAIALLGVPGEDRESFIKENNIDSMSTRELQQAIKDREQALKENEDLRAKLNNTENTIHQVETERNKFRSENSDLKVNISRADRVSADRMETIKTLQAFL